MGRPRRSPGESVAALEEGMRIIRGFLDGDRSLRMDGEHYSVAGAKPGPANVGLDDPGAWLEPGRLSDFANRHELDVVLVSVPDDEPLAFIRELGARAPSD